MRVTADRDDPAFRQDLIGSNIVIECDGVVIEKVITADEQAGTVLAYATGDDGDILLSDDGQSARTYEMTGRVVIHLPPERWAASA